ncbi:hypothetical protein BpHYR1_045492 [Brachionus plicatilis]|uniref:Uncharacterized protein n=1 Tax=Brachionus plicatilis TaxID=10195 RepID=A0A3M7QAB7_BRAPC|nr:hypothetical protein BpHYR1_045492 [Brachionus plicatilis]
MKIINEAKNQGFKEIIILIQFEFFFILTLHLLKQEERKSKQSPEVVYTTLSNGTNLSLIKIFCVHLLYSKAILFITKTSIIRIKHVFIFTRIRKRFQLSSFFKFTTS